MSNTTRRAQRAPAILFRRDVPTLPRNDIASPAISLSPGGRAILPAAIVPPRSHLGRRVRAGLFIPGSDFRAVLRISSVSRPQPGSYATHSDADAFHSNRYGAFDDREAVQVSQE